MKLESNNLPILPKIGHQDQNHQKAISVDTEVDNILIKQKDINLLVKAYKETIKNHSLNPWTRDKIAPILASKNLDFRNLDEEKKRMVWSLVQDLSVELMSDYMSTPLNLRPEVEAFLRNNIDLKTEEDIKYALQSIILCEKIMKSQQEVIDEEVAFEANIKDRDFNKESDETQLFLKELQNKSKEEDNLFIYNYIESLISEKNADNLVNTAEEDNVIKKIEQDLLAVGGNQELNESLFYSVYTHPVLQQSIENTLNIKLSDFSTKEQVYIFNYFLNLKRKDSQRVNNFSKTYEVKGLRTFLSLEHGGKEMGDKILTLGEKLPEKSAKILFGKYSEIIDSVDETVNILKERFGKDTENPEIINSIRENLLKKGKDLLADSSKMLDKCSKDDCIEVGNVLSERLENMKKEAIMLGSAFKTVAKDGMSLDQIKDVSVESFTNTKELEKYKNEMIQIFKDNRIGHPPELLKETLHEFEDALANPENKEFFLLKDKEMVIAFMRFDELPNGNIYAGSLNARNEVQGFAIGGALLKQLLEDKAKTHTIEAVVYEKNAMLPRYLSEFGFKITGEIENHKSTRQKFYNIEIKKNSKE